MNRRSMLKLLGSVPVVGPDLARKLSSEASAAGLAKIHTSGLQYESSEPPSTDETNFTQRQLAIQLPWVRQELEQLMLERNTRVSTLDPDLAVLKSVSLSAKICYQRQRNVQRDIVKYTSSPNWMRVDQLFAKVRGILG